jgi:hypothetical protein
LDAVSDSPLLTCGLVHQSADFGFWISLDAVSDSPLLTCGLVHQSADFGFWISLDAVSDSPLLTCGLVHQSADFGFGTWDGKQPPRQPKRLPPLLTRRGALRQPRASVEISSFVVIRPANFELQINLVTLNFNANGANTGNRIHARGNRARKQRGKER